MDEHVSIEKIIYGNLSEKELKHISSCQKCNKIYKSIFAKVPENLVATIENNVREELILKFREMKALGHLNRSIPKKIIQKNGKQDILKYIAVSLSFLVFAVLTFTLLYIGNFENITQQKIRYENKVSLSFNNLTKDKIKVEVKDSSLIIKLTETPKSFSFKGIAESNFQNIKIIIGNQVYEFFGSEFNAVYSDSKLIVNGKTLTPTKEESRIKGFKNEIILNDGSVIKCNVEEIGESFIIIETEEGKRRLNKSEISKIRYLH
jgi:phosphotransferase system IIB component